MAVVQISKIQVRRGQKNSNSGVPQLSSAEFAWAVDTQELFIGNGSVAEGAPYVGNTKVLTEHDNILALASSYQFASTDPSISSSIPRPLQSKLDEYVSIADFGAVGDGVTDNSVAIAAALEELFTNNDENYRKVLMVPNGVYVVNSDIRIPAGRLSSLDPLRNVIIRGETQLGSIINIGANDIRFITVDGKENVDFDSVNRPRNVLISNLTIQRTTGEFVISGLADSKFEDVRFKGSYVLGTTVASLASEPAAVSWNNGLAGTKVDNITFSGCIFDSNSLSVKCSQTLVYDTSLILNECKFFNNDTGIYISGVATQKNNWRVLDCEFEEIANQAFRSTQGQGTSIQRSKFKKCGNGTGLASAPIDNIVYFGESINNILIDCTSDRQSSAGLVSTVGVPAIAEVIGSSKSTFLDRNYSLIYLSDSFRPLAVFSALNRYMKINYFLSLDVWSRVGTLTISVGDDLSEVAITDEFQYSTPLAASPGGQVMTKFEFNAELRDNDLDSGIETVVLSYKNPLLTGRAGTISFDVAYGV